MAEPSPASATEHPPDGVDATRSHELLHQSASTVLEGGVSAAYDSLAARIREDLDCEAAMIAVRNRLGRRCRIQAASGLAKFRRHSPIAAAAEEVLNDACSHNAPIQYDDDDAPTATSADAAGRLAGLCSARCVVSGPIRDRRRNAIGAWLALRKERPAATDETLWAEPVDELNDKLSAQLGPCLQLLQQCRPHPLQRLMQAARGQDAQKRRRTLIYVATALVCLMAAPLPYRVKCDGVVQAISRRYVPVPYTGVLRKVLVEPGDVVKPGQIIAQMDGREIAWELAARQAEYEQARKKHDVELAGQNTAAAQVAALEMQRLELQIELLKNRASNLEIRSPIAGVIIRGDAKKMESARLNMGETLFEVGPLNRVAVDVFVPDEDVAYVAPDQHVKVRLDAFPGATQHGTIRRISPQAEARNQQSVFLAEVELNNKDGSLRPGMMGRCQIRTVLRPLAWNLFHRAWDRLVYLLAW